MSSCSEKLLKDAGFYNVSDLLLSAKDAENFIARAAGIPAEIRVKLHRMVVLAQLVGREHNAPKHCGCGKPATVAAPGHKAGFPT